MDRRSCLGMAAAGAAAIALKASAGHVANWPLLEKTLTDKNYTVIFTQAV